jgi:DNA repair protein RecO (recombination protein O)
VPPIRTPALILHCFPYGDTSKILRLLTPEHGLRSVIAKGAYGPKSRFGALLEPFTAGEAQFNLREGPELFILTGFALSRSRQGLGRNLAAFTGASLLAEVALRCGTEEPHPELYELMVSGLDRLADPRVHASAAAIPAVWSLISLLGYRPEMESCISCGRGIGFERAAAFDLGAGGIVCPDCRPELPMLPGEVRRQVASMAGDAGTVQSAMDFRSHGSLLGRFLEAHLAHDRPLRSLPLFLEQLE